MRVVMIAAVSALALGGCRTLSDEGNVTSEDQRFACDATRVQAMLGQPATQALGAEAVRASGARTMRWIRPGDAVTMDYRTDRLNVHLDEANKVVRVVCG
jgi:hypothetical protein